MHLYHPPYLDYYWSGQRTYNGGTIGPSTRKYEKKNQNSDSVVLILFEFCLELSFSIFDLGQKKKNEIRDQNATVWTPEFHLAKD